MNNNSVMALAQELKAVNKTFTIRSATAAQRLLRKGILVLSNGLPVGLSHEAEETIVKLFGVNIEQFNMTFHKSFETVETMSPDEYYAEQIMHYFSTYGAEMMGINIPTYIPAEQLDLPNGMIDLSKITILRAVNDDEQEKLVNDWFRRIAAPSPTQTINANALLDIATLPLEEIRSFELQILKYDRDGIVPSNPNSFLRYLVFKTTGSTLVIKNRDMRKAIYRADASLAKSIFQKADLESLSSIFLRNKRLFLAYKKLNGCAPYVNKLRRLADKYHKPLQRECVQNAVAFAKEGNMTVFAEIVEKASIRELVKLSCAISARIQAAVTPANVPQIISIRNGRTFVRSGDEYSAEHKQEIVTRMIRAEELLEKQVAERLAGYEGKYFVIPKYIDYAVPTSEKQFVGAYPFGTRLLFSNGAITAGIHWFNDEAGGGWDDGRVDLDLHLNSVSAHYGWNSGFRSGDKNDVIYTGDMTDAPRPTGAAEAYYLTPKDDAFVLSICKYCGPESEDYKLFFTDVKPAAKGRGYTFDPEATIIPPVPMNIHSNNENIGLLEDGRFTFYGGSISTGIVPAANYADYITALRAALHSKFKLDDLLAIAGAKIVDSADEVPSGAEYVDLSPQVLTTQTLMGVVDGEATFAEKKDG